MVTAPDSKRFPFIDLEKALGRALTMYNADRNGRPMALQTLYEVWEYSPKSSGGHQTIGALKAYGLIAKDNQGRIGLTDNAQRYFKDERPLEKERLLKLFALRPKMFGYLWSVWGDAPPADNVARSFLKLDIGLGEQQSRALLGLYKENLNFAKLKGGDTIIEGDDEDDEEDAEVNTQTSDAGTAASADLGKGSRAPKSEGNTLENFTVQQVGRRLKIAADVDLEGIKKLRLLLDQYEAILKLMN